MGIEKKKKCLIETKNDDMFLSSFLLPIDPYLVKTKVTEQKNDDIVELVIPSYPYLGPDVSESITKLGKNMLEHLIENSGLIPSIDFSMYPKYNKLSEKLQIALTADGKNPLDNVYAWMSGEQMYKVILPLVVNKIPNEKINKDWSTTNYTINLLKEEIKGFNYGENN